MKNSKKIVAIALALVMLVGGVIAGTMAWFTDIEDDNYTIEVGDVSIKLTNTAEESEVLMPGLTDMNTNVTNVTVENTGSQAAYVRVKITVDKDWAHVIHFNTGSAQWDDINAVDVDKETAADGNTTYTLYLKEALAAGQTTATAIAAFYLDQWVDCDLNEDDEVTYWYNNVQIGTAGDQDMVFTVVAEAMQVTGYESDVDAAWAAFDAQTAHTEQNHYPNYDDVNY